VVPVSVSSAETRPPPPAEAAPQPAGSRTRHRASIPPVVWLILLANLVVLGAYAVMLPAYRSPDEPFHFALVRLVEQTDAYPNWNDAVFDPHVVTSLGLDKFETQSAHLTKDQAVPRSKRPSFSQIAPAAQPGFNIEAQHPPLYYVVIAAGLRESQAVMPFHLLRAWDQEMVAARLLSALLIAPIPLLVWLTAKRLRLSTPAALTATLVPLAIPQLQFIGASVNNDDMLALLAAALTYLVVRIATGDTRTRTIVLAGVVTGLALLAKAFAYVFPIWVLVAIAVGRTRGRERIKLRDVGIFLGVAFASGGWWYARSLVEFGSLNPSLDVARFPHLQGFKPNWPNWFHVALRTLNYTSWANFGWYDTHVAYVVSVIAVAVLGAAILIAFFAPRRTSSSATPTSPTRASLPTRTAVLLLLAPLFLVGAEVIEAAGHTYAYSGQLPGLQGRYLFSAVAGLAVIVGIAVAVIGRYAPRIAKWCPIVMLALIATMHVLSVRVIFNFWWGATNASFVERLQAFAAWCPWSPVWLATATIVGVGAIVTMVVAVVRTSLSTDESSETSATDSAGVMPSGAMTASV
jgi:4-amino-4-deoxy-L-arabinose transferase-like glycosyltransferase